MANLNKKLQLNKETIAELDNMNEVYGGASGNGCVAPTRDVGSCDPLTCPLAPTTVVLSRVSQCIC